MKQYLFLLLFFHLLFPAWGQDVVYFHKETPPAYGKIISITPYFIQFSPLTDSLLIQTFSTDSIYQVRFNDTLLFSITKDIDLDVNKQLGVLKIAPAAPLFGHFDIGYEHYLKKGRSVQLTLSMIYHRSNKSKYYNDNGFYGWLGYKINLSKKKAPFQNEKQLLHGFYLQPTLLFGFIHNKIEEETITYVEYGQWRTYVTQNAIDEILILSGIFLTPGYQLVNHNGYTLDLNISIGYVNGTTRAYKDYYYAYWTPDNSIPLGISGSVKIGYAFLTEKRYQMNN